MARVAKFVFSPLDLIQNNMSRTQKDKALHGEHFCQLRFENYLSFAYHNVKILLSIHKYNVRGCFLNNSGTKAATVARFSVS